MVWFWYPREEYEMRVTRVVPASRVYMPCTLVMVPMAVPVKATLTNGRGAPVLPSKTLPDTEVWAAAQSPNPHNIHVSSLGVNGRGVCPVSVQSICPSRTATTPAWTQESGSSHQGG